MSVLVVSWRKPARSEVLPIVSHAGLFASENSMKIMQQTDTKLTLNIGIPYFNQSQCDFDRTTGRARIKRAVVFWPLKTVDVPLSEISSIAVSVQHAGSAERGQTKYSPEILFKSGKCINLWANSESSATKAVAAMNAFLQAGSVASA
jgi:hypothetical protein